MAQVPKSNLPTFMKTCSIIVSCEVTITKALKPTTTHKGGTRGFIIKIEVAKLVLVVCSQST